MKILHFASWFPSKENEFEGIFAKKHIFSMNLFAKNFVIYLKYNKNLKNIYTIEKFEENGIIIYYTYLRNIKSHLPILSTSYKIFNYYVALIITLIKVIKENGFPDISFIYINSKIGIPAYILKFLFKIPYLIIEQSTLYSNDVKSKEYFKNITRLEHNFNGFLYKNANGVLCVSKYLVNRLKKHFPLEKQNFYIIKNIVDIANNNNLVREKSLVTISSLKKVHKRVGELIIAFSKSNYKENNFKFVIIGDGPDKAELIELSNKLGLLNKYIFFEGYIQNKQLPKYLSTSSFLIINSAYETFSIVAAEAIALGLPVLTTPCGGPEEFVNGERGIILKDFEEETLINGLNRMYLNYETFNHDLLKKYAVDNFTYEVVSKRFQNIIEEVLNN